MAVRGGSVTPATEIFTGQVRGFQAFRVINGAGMGRRTIGGTAMPILVLGQNDVVARGGMFHVIEGSTIPMVRVVGRGVKGEVAYPVYPVDANGNYDPAF